MSVIIKFCKRCNAETERNANRDCKPCAIKRGAIWYKENKERAKATKRLYRVANSERIKKVRAVYCSANAESRKAASAAYRKDNPEKIRAANAAYWKANPEARRVNSQNRRARKLANGGKLSKGLAERLLKLQKGKCPCCKQPLGDDYHMDHIMPLAKGGANEDWNIQLLRQQCNQQKHARDPIEFMQSRGKLL